MDSTLKPVQVPTSGPSFARVLQNNTGSRLNRAPLRELQVNVGKRCNQACSHCHVDAGPKRTEIMQWDTMEQILDWFRRARLAHVDITGGAPELNPNFRRFVDGFLALGAAVTSRCNLTVLLETGQDTLARWYAHRHIHLVCSLPCYTERNVDEQRGSGVFRRSIDALRLLNRQGYGTDARVLDLVYNPNGAHLPGPQHTLEADYRHWLLEEYGIRFNRLLTLANLPINRFAHYLQRTGQSETYQQLLVQAFNPDTVNDLMCRHLLSVDWRGLVYDCDFNQMLDLPMSGTRRRYLWEIQPVAVYGAPIAVDRHCFGCTAGSGSSCGGALVDEPAQSVSRAGRDVA